jgi:hypothetical protein
MIHPAILPMEGIMTERNGAQLHRLVMILGLTYAGLPLACSGSDGSANGTGGNGGAQSASSGGATTITGGAAGGLSTGAGGTSTIGGSVASSGGTNANGGTSANGGTVASSGGATANGGTSSNGGSSAGVGGTSATGATGGTNATGGTSSKGGSSASTGGTNATGGTSSKGGSSAGGGTNSTGGTLSNGGSSASTGGIPATGGSVACVPVTGGTVAAAITKDAESQIALSGLTTVSYGGYLNGESFQQEGIVSFNGYQYSAFWNNSATRRVVLARRALPGGAWEKFEFSDYALAAEDAHNTISLGVTPGDGTLHLSFDHHNNNLHYRRSSTGFLTNPASVTWTSAAASFSAVTSALVGTTTVTLVTYPRFITEPGGNKMLFSARIGQSGSGDEYLWEYDSATHNWISLGKYIDGITNNMNAYLHGLSYTRGGTRLHASWCWRDTPDASTNHDLDYVYSDDNGRTWMSNAGAVIGATGTNPLTLNTAGINVWPISTNRGLINQEHMAVDSVGRVHVLLSHMPDAQANDATFDSARTKSQFFHYFRDTCGKWTRVAIGLPVIANFRGKFAISSSNNVYAILPDLRIAAASPSNNYATWAQLTSDSGRFFSDPLIDTARLLTEDKLTIYDPQKASPNIWALDYTVK